MDGVMEGQRVQKDAPVEADAWWMRKEAGRNCFLLDRSQLDGNGEKIKQKAQGDRWEKGNNAWAYLVSQVTVRVENDLQTIEWT
jgi:hypothetical protein